MRPQPPCPLIQRPLLAAPFAPVRAEQELTVLAGAVDRLTGCRRGRGLDTLRTLRVRGLATQLRAARRTFGAVSAQAEGAHSSSCPVRSVAAAPSACHASEAAVATPVVAVRPTDSSTTKPVSRDVLCTSVATLPAVACPAGTPSACAVSSVRRWRLLGATARGTHQVNVRGGHRARARQQRLEALLRRAVRCHGQKLGNRLQRRKRALDEDEAADAGLQQARDAQLPKPRLAQRLEDGGAARACVLLSHSGASAQMPEPEAATQLCAQLGPHKRVNVARRGAGECGAATSFSKKRDTIVSA